MYTAVIKYFVIIQKQKSFQEQTTTNGETARHWGMDAWKM